MNHVQVEWDNADHTVVRLTLYEDWSWAELYEANKSIISMMSSTDQTVHLLVDTTYITAVPLGGVITHARNILGAYPPNCDLRILVTRSMLIQRLASTFQVTFRADLGRRLHCVASDEAAYHLMQKTVPVTGQ